MPADISEKILAFYDDYDEAGRFYRGIGLLEFERTKGIFLQFLPSPPAVIFDIGGGPGAHAFWLAERGYHVHLLDLSPKHIEQARQRMAQAGSPQLANLQVADARKLDYPAEIADAVILHGPLYHLVDQSDRLTALRQAQRILRPGGWLFAVAITRSASTLVGLTQDWIWDPAYLEMAKEEWTTGQHRRPAFWPNLFTNAHFHEPVELREEIAKAGCIVQKILGIQGPGWIAPNFESNWNDPKRRETIMQIARMAEDHPVLNPHMIAIAQKTQ